MKLLKLPVSLFFIVILFPMSFVSNGQTVDKSALAISVSTANQANFDKLKQYTWQRKDEIYKDNILKLTSVTQNQFTEEGKIKSTPLESTATEKAKPGLRGVAQQSGIEANKEYIEKAIGVMFNYGYLTKGELVDLFDKASVNPSKAILLVNGSNIFVQGDKINYTIDSKTNLFQKKEFNSFVDKDPIDGVIYYETFSSGINHISKMELNMPVKGLKVVATNISYSVQVK